MSNERYKLNTDIELPLDVISIVRAGRQMLAERRAAEAEKQRQQEEQQKREEEESEKRVAEQVESLKRHITSFAVRTPYVHQYINWNEDRIRAALEDGRGLPVHEIEIHAPGFTPIVLTVRYQNASVVQGKSWDLQRIKVMPAEVNGVKPEALVSQNMPEALALARELYLATRPELAPA